MRKPSVKGPVALTTRRAWISKRAPVSPSTTSAPRARPRRSRAIRSTATWLAAVGAGRFGVEHVLQHQPGVVGLTVDVDLRAFETGAAQVGRQGVERVRVEAPAGRGRAPERQRVVERDAGAQRDEAGALAAIAREDELDRPTEMRRRRHEAPSLAQPLEHQRQIAVLQVAQAAVDQLRRVAGGLAGEVAGVDQRHREAAQGRVARDRRAGRAAADDEEVERLGREPGQRGRARASGPPSPGHSCDHSLSAMCSSSS